MITGRQSRYGTTIGSGFDGSWPAKQRLPDEVPVAMRRLTGLS